MGSSPEGVTVLHVDDDPAFVEMAGEFLERNNERFTVIPETTVSEALERLADADIDCIVSDFDMPEMTGIEFLERVREDYPDLPFILFTGKGSEEVASEAISTGVTDYIQKAHGTDRYDLLANRIENSVSKYRAEKLVDRAYRAMDRSREGIALLDENGEFLYVNSEYTEVVGYEEDELIGNFWEMVYPDEQAERIHEHVLSEVPDEGYWSGDTVYKRKDGSRVLVNHALIYSEDETMICLIRNVSDSEARERALREERERFEFFVNTVDEYAMFLLDPDGYVTTWNPGAERIKGYTENDILGAHFSVFYTEEAREVGRPRELLDQAEAAGTVTDEGWRVRADGSKFWADVTITALTDEEGNLRGYGKVTKDLTERKTREMTLQQTQDQFDTLPDVFYVVNEDGSFQRFNERLSEITGYTTAELESIHSLELVPDEDRAEFEDQHDRLLETDEVVTNESWLVTKDGEHIPHEFRRRRLTDPMGDVLGFAGIARDITERKEYERQLERHIDRLNEFASVLTHDLKNPLTAAKLRLSMVEDQLGEGDREHVEVIDRSLGRIEEIIGDVLEITRTGSPVTEPEETEVTAVARRMWDEMEKGAVHPELGVTEIGEIMADSSLLERLLMNLFRNSVEHGDKGVHVRVGPLEDGFYVEDDGPGIPAEDREAIFDWKFSTKEDGSGIGLKSVEQIVHAHDWEIEVTESDEGGARFEITGVFRL